MTDIPCTLPPDPSAAGLWWVHNDEVAREIGELWANEVWLWDTGGAWIGGSARDEFDPKDAHAAGWRVVGPAVPPGDKV